MNTEQSNKSSVIMTSVITTLVVLALVALGVWNNRVSVAQFLLATSSQSVSQNGDVKHLSAGEASVVNVVQNANPAVVSIVITKEVPTYRRIQNPFNDFFDQFFGIPQYEQNGSVRRQVGGGSGFFVSSDGLILTNKHVVSDESADYTVFTNDGTSYPATIVALDPVMDVAVMRVQGDDFPHLEFGDSSELVPGQTVIAIGNALGEFSNTVSVGVVSGLSRSIVAGDGRGESEELNEVIQTDAAINPGNSGGPLLDLNGRVVGMNVAAAQGSENIGFALPANAIKGAVSSIESTGRISRPYLGVRYVNITEEIKERNNLSVDYGVLVLGDSSTGEVAVIPGPPAAKAGIVAEDIILEFDGVKIDNNNKLPVLIQNKKVGDAVTLKILRNGVERVVNLTLEEYRV